MHPEYAQVMCLIIQDDKKWCSMMLMRAWGTYEADFFAVELADECFEPLAAVAHCQSAWYHSRMASSLIRHKMGCHSLSPSGARSLPHLFLCCSKTHSLICGTCASKNKEETHRVGFCFEKKNFQNRIFNGYAAIFGQTSTCVYLVWLTMWQTWLNYDWVQPFQVPTLH